MKYIVGFARFWYDFIVGDSVVLAIGGIAVVVAGALLVHLDSGGMAEFVMPGIVLLTLGVSALLPRR